MNKIVFFCIPANGHTNPMLGVVREKIEASGAKFVVCDDFDSEQKLDPKDAVRVGKDLVFSTKLLVDTILALDDIVCKDMECLQPDCIVADGFKKCTGAKGAADKILEVSMSKA